MNKKFIHKPKIKIIYSEFRSSQKPKIKIKNSTLLFPRMSVPRSRSFLFFYKNKKYALSAYLKKLFWWSCRELPSGPKGNILAFYKLSLF